MYTIMSNKWVTLNNFPKAICKAATCTLGDKMFMSGGQDGKGKPYSEVYEYEPKGDIWLVKGNASVPFGQRIQLN